MTGADRVKVISQDQSLSDMGGKQISEIMGADVSIEWTEYNGKVTGNFPKVEGWKDFSGVEAEQSGHYFASELDEQYEGQKVTTIGAHQKTAQDRRWVIRLDELYAGSKKLTVKVGGSTIFTLDFTGATLAAA